MLLAVLAHVDAHQGVLVVEHELGQRLGQLGLAHAGGAEEDERADRAARVLQAGAGPADGVGDGVDGLVLADDALVQALLHLQQLVRLGLHHLVDRDAGPLGDDLGDVVLVHHLVQVVLGLPGVALAR